MRPSSTSCRLPRWAAVATLLAGAAATGPLSAQPSGATDGGLAAAAKVWASCAEHLPEGAVRPGLTVSFPDRGLSGYETRLEVVVEHGPGETVLPEGFRIQHGSDAARAIEAAGFVIPHPDGGSPPRIDAKKLPGKSATTLSLPFVPLPEEAGRHVMVLPPIPIAVGRASGEVMTLCTEPQTITVEDPIANEAEPEVKGNPPPRPQREPWALAKQLFIGGLIAIALAVLLAWLITRWLRRPKPVKPRPKVLPWIAAMRELEEIRGSNWLKEDRTDEYFDRVDDCVRFYLGERYGFDGLESTTEEMRKLLARIVPPPAEQKRIVGYLVDSDLIKFTEMTPTREDCTGAMERAETIIRLTTPPPITRKKVKPGQADDGSGKRGRAA